MRSEPLSIWVVYDHPKDFPDHFIARRWLANDTLTPTSDFYLADDLESLRGQLPAGLYRLPAQPGDDPSIVETWM